MSKGKLLDLFCGAGGAAKGYADAGYEVTGVDIKPQPHFPFTFILAEALEYVAAHGGQFDVIHASPPCQAYSRLKGLTTQDHPQLIPITRKLLILSGKTWVIENVSGAPLNDPMVLCGTMFGLKVYRHRLFESNVRLQQPTHPKHVVRIGSHRAVKMNDQGWVSANGGGHWVEAGRTAMGIPWMIQRELAQAVPPAYTQYIGEYIGH